jgi:hypothetical protein
MHDPTEPPAERAERLFLSILVLPVMPFWLVRSGLSPRRGEPKAWYDRVIRVAGGLIFGGLVYVGGVVAIYNYWTSR